MGQKNHFSQWGRRLLGRLRGDRGATLVEYGLVVAAIVAVSVPGIDYLTDQGDQELSNQANCVSERPPPPSCLVPAVTTTVSTVSTTTTTAGPTSSTTSSTSSTSTSTTAPPTPSDVEDWTASATWTGYSPTSGGQITLPVNITNEGNPVEGATVQVRIQITQPPTGQSFYAQCTTDASGTCTIAWDVPFIDATQVSVTPTDISADPPVGTPPPALTFTR